VTLDATDRKILAALQRKGRMSNADLSEQVNLSPSACHRRVQRLEAEGFIRDYVALLDARKLDLPTTVFVEITLQGQADELLDAFEKAVSRIPDVLECHLMAGTADYILKIVAGNTEDFARIHRQYLSRLRRGGADAVEFRAQDRVQDHGAALIGPPLGRGCDGVVPNPKDAVACDPARSMPRVSAGKDAGRGSDTKR